MKLQYNILENETPNSISLINSSIGKTNDKTKLYNWFDSNGVRVFISYGASGGFGVCLYRKKTQKESSGESDWRMVRESIISSYLTRDAAEEVGFQKAFYLLEELLTQ
jgi:hypothetical protein